MRRLGLAAVLSAVFYWSGCGDGVTPPPPEGETPADCLKAFEEALAERSLSDFQGRLDETFVFYFDPSDVGRTANNYEVPASWLYEEESQAVANLLTYAYSIEVDLPTTDAEVGEPDEGATEYTAYNLTMEFSVETLEGYGWHAAGFFDASFTKEGDTWRVREWTDRTAPDGLVEGIHEESYGYIKALFYGWPSGR